MEIEAAMENSQPQNHSSDAAAASASASASLDHNNNNNNNNYVPHLSHTNGDGESDRKLSAEEVKKALETTASTGKFWIDWEELKRMLYFQLKQVLSEYPEATMSNDEQNSALGESYLQLVKRLEEALFSFIDGPPFTLQRLSEILLHARTIYPNLSKLALALEKNLLVTSTLTKSTDPCPPSIVQPEEQAEDTQAQAQAQSQSPSPSQPEPEPKHETEQQQPETEQSNPHSSNGGELTMGDKDEVMTEVDTEVDAVDDGTVEMEAFERIINTPDTIPEPASDSLFPSQVTNESSSHPGGSGAVTQGVSVDAAGTFGLEFTREEIDRIEHNLANAPVYDPTNRKPVLRTRMDISYFLEPAAYEIPLKRKKRTATKASSSRRTNVRANIEGVSVAFTNAPGVEDVLPSDVAFGTSTPPRVTMTKAAATTSSADLASVEALFAQCLDLAELLRDALSQSEKVSSHLKVLRLKPTSTIETLDKVCEACQKAKDLKVEKDDLLANLKLKLQLTRKLSDVHDRQDLRMIELSKSLAAAESRVKDLEAESMASSDRLKQLEAELVGKAETIRLREEQERAWEAEKRAWEAEKATRQALIREVRVASYNEGYNRGYTECRDLIAEVDPHFDFTKLEDLEDAREEEKARRRLAAKGGPTSSAK